MNIQTNSAIIAATAPTAIAERAILTRALDVISGVVERKNTLPILSNCRLQGDGETLFVSGHNLTDGINLEIVAAIPAAADPRLDATIPAHGFRDFLKKAMASDYVSISHEQTDDEDTVKLDFERVNYNLQALPGSDMPEFEPVNYAGIFSIPGNAFASAIASIQGAMSVEAVRYYLNGIFCHKYDGDLVMVATDGHRLYRRVMALPEGAEAMPDVIIPRKTVALLHKLTKGNNAIDAVTVSAAENRIRFQFDLDGMTITITSNTVDGTFPDYHRVIPTGNDKVATFDADTLVEAVRAVALVSSERGRALKMEVHECAAILTVVNPDKGRAEAEIPCSFAGGPIEVGFNNKYILEMISTATSKGEEITANFSDSSGPAVWTSSLEGWTGVVMPMRI